MQSLINIYNVYTFINVVYISISSVISNRMMLPDLCRPILPHLCTNLTGDATASNRIIRSTSAISNPSYAIQVATNTL